ncbi:MAG: glycosyltransferase [Vampirovibrionales bacterium]|nr:glycosyltransferase [Vampirovibrionales bacterium]
MPLLSITIPTYKRPERLRELLWGLCKQIEALPDDLKGQADIWVNDNASGDDTEAMVKKFAAKYPFITYVCNAQNLGADRNVGVAMQRPAGTFIWLLCDDDLPTKNAVERLLRQIQDIERQRLANGPTVNLIHSNSFHRTVEMNDMVMGRMYTDHGHLSLMTGEAMLKKFHMALLRASTLIFRKGTYDGPFVDQYLTGYLCSPLVLVLQCLSGQNTHGYYMDDPLLTYRENHKPWWGLWPLVVVYYIPLMALFAVRAGLYNASIITPFLYTDIENVRKYLYLLKKTPPEAFTNEPQKHWHLSFWTLFKLYARKKWFWDECVWFCLLPYPILRTLLRLSPLKPHLSTPGVILRWMKGQLNQKETIQSKVVRASQAARTFSKLERVAVSNG